jgi:hypothetical protein
MDDDATTPSALMVALALAQEHGGAWEALRVTGLELDATERFAGLSDELADSMAGRSPGEALHEALALGFLAGRVAHGPGRATDPASIPVDGELLGRHAARGSSLRLAVVRITLVADRRLRRAAELDRAAAALEGSARVAERHAELQHIAGHRLGEEESLELVEQFRRAARRARAIAGRQRSTGPGPADAPRPSA